MKIRDITRIGLFTSLTVVGGMMSISIGPVPISMQTGFVLLAAIVLKPGLAAYSQLVYILLGLAGLPVFAGARGGISSFLSPSFGFVLSFIPAAYLVGLLLERGDYDRKRIRRALIIGNLVIFSLGLSYMYFIMNIYLGNSLDFMGLMKLGLIPFIPGEILKMGLVIEVGLRMQNLYPKNIRSIKINQ